MSPAPFVSNATKPEGDDATFNRGRGAVYEVTWLEVAMRGADEGLAVRADICAYGSGLLVLDSVYMEVGAGVPSHNRRRRGGKSYQTRGHVNLTTPIHRDASTDIPMLRPPPPLPPPPCCHLTKIYHISFWFVSHPVSVTYHLPAARSACCTSSSTSGSKTPTISAQAGGSSSLLLILW